MANLILFNKPYGVLSQFTDSDNRPTLARYIKLPHIYPAGRLDFDSEGLLLLTDDGQVQHQIAHPAQKSPKTYWVQVEGAPNSYALTKLRQGVELNDGMTQPAEVKLIPRPTLWERNPPIRTRANIPTQWVEIVITEGRNRQVRRMTAAVGHPTLRLVRVKIGQWSLEGIEPGKFKIEAINAPTPNFKGAQVKRKTNKPATSIKVANDKKLLVTDQTQIEKLSKNNQPARQQSPIAAKSPSTAAKHSTKILVKPKPKLPPG